MEAPIFREVMDKATNIKEFDIVGCCTDICVCTDFDEVFDIVIITGTLNAKVFSQNISRAQKIILHSKESLESMLKSCTLPGDLILFSNDAPNFI